MTNPAGSISETLALKELSRVVLAWNSPDSYFRFWRCAWIVDRPQISFNLPSFHKDDPAIVSFSDFPTLHAPAMSPEGAVVECFFPFSFIGFSFTSSSISVPLKDHSDSGCLVGCANGDESRIGEG